MPYPTRPILLRDTPPAICDACGSQCMTLDQAGILCYHCHAGVFVHRSHWDFWWCSACGAADAACDYCHGIGLVATPAEREGVAPVQPRRRE